MQSCRESNESDFLCECLQICKGSGLAPKQAKRFTKRQVYRNSQVPLQSWGDWPRSYLETNLVALLLLWKLVWNTVIVWELLTNKSCMWTVLTCCCLLLQRWGAGPGEPGGVAGLGPDGQGSRGRAAAAAGGGEEAGPERGAAHAPRGQYPTPLLLTLQQPFNARLQGPFPHRKPVLLWSFFFISSLPNLETAGMLPSEEAFIDRQKGNHLIFVWILFGETAQKRAVLCKVGPSSFFLYKILAWHDPLLSCTLLTFAREITSSQCFGTSSSVVECKVQTNPAL